MTKFSALGFPVISLAIASMLAGCGGGSSSSPASASNAMPAATSQIASLAEPDSKKCMSDNGVSVKPCSVGLSISQPTQTVTTHGPNNGTFSFKDTSCTSKNVAEVTGTGNSYTVTAGTTAGNCSVKFIDKDTNGKRIGVAKLTITNQV